MKLTLFFWSLCAIAGPIDHTLPAIARELPSQPFDFNAALAFHQGNVSSAEPEISSPSLSARASDDPPAGTVFINARDWQWDETDTNSADKRRVVAAWDMALELIKSAMAQLKTLETDVLNYKASTEGQTTPEGLPLDFDGKKLAARTFIGQNDPAYTQMFGADQFSIGLIHNNFKKLRNGITKQDAEGRNNNLIYLTAIKKDALQYQDGKKDPVNLCTGSTQAFFVPISTMFWFREAKKNDKNWDNLGPEKAPPDNAYSINFCDNFFKLDDMTTQLQSLKDGAKKEDICNLAIDTTARVMLHEWTHFPFTLDTNRPDDRNENVAADHVGYKDTATISVTDRDNQGTKVGVVSSRNADSYAQFAVYGYLNNLDGCNGVHWTGDEEYETARCKIDVWPQAVNKKEVKSSWDRWNVGDRDKLPEIRCEDD